MNVYDWDGTIYNGDSTMHFIMYLWEKYPHTRNKIPGVLWKGLLFKLSVIDVENFKGSFYQIFSTIPNMEEVVDAFTSSHLKNVKKWYFEQQKPDDLVISASPYFLISSFCKKVNITHVMASPVNIHTGKFEGKNCHGEEKVRRFKEMYPDASIDSFYSDSNRDLPLARIAKKPFFVKGNQRSPWKV